jgi:hypothetical protein
MGNDPSNITSLIRLEHVFLGLPGLADVKTGGFVHLPDLLSR